MSNFKIGDKVRVIGKRNDYHMFPSGAIVEVIGPGMSPKSYSCRDEGGLEQYVPKEDLVSIQGKILVTTDGVVTTAKLFHGKELVKSAEAKCSPSDAFDFEKGAALAVERLLGSEKKEKKLFPLADIKAGYLLKVRDDDGAEYFMTVALSDSGLGCCAPGKHWWPLSSFDRELRYDDSSLVAVYGCTCNKFLLANSPVDRPLLWSRD